jgi:transposase-like protein
VEVDPTPWAEPPKVYSPEFRQKIMELIRSGESGNVVARRFDVSQQTISNWLKPDDLNAVQVFFPTPEENRHSTTQSCLRALHDCVSSFPSAACA